jgi:hypothetical protein
MRSKYFNDIQYFWSKFLYVKSHNFITVALNSLFDY